MALTIEYRRDRKASPMAFTTDRRLYLSRDRSRVVEEGDREAAFLLAAVGREITEADATAYGLEYVNGKVVLPGVAKPEPQKAAAKPEDKSAAKSEDKAAKRK